MVGTLLRNALSNWVGFLVNAVIAFLLTPFVLRSLGAERYGIWALVMGLVGYYGLLDFGLRPGVTHHIVRHLAVGNTKRVNYAVSTALVALLFCGAVAVVATLLGAWLAPAIFSIDPKLAHEMRWCILLVGGSLAVQITLAPFSALFSATQRYDAANAIGISTRLLTAAGTVMVLRAGHGLEGLSVVICAGNVLDSCLRWWVAYWIFPELSVAYSLASIREMRPILSFSGLSLLVQGAMRLIYSSDQIVIACFMPVAAIAPYTLAIAVVDHFARMFRPIAVVFFPAATQLHEQSDHAALQRMYLTGSRILFCLAAILGVVAATWSADFYRLWVGAGFATTGFGSVTHIFGLLLVGGIVTAGQRIGYQVLMGTKRLRALAILLSCEAAINLVMSLSLVHAFGLIGVALGTLVPAVVFQGIAHPLVVCRSLGCPLTTYYRVVVSRALLLAGLTSTVCWGVYKLVPPATSWGHIVFNGMLTMVPATALLLVIGLSGNERSQIQTWFARRINRTEWETAAPGIDEDLPETGMPSAKERK